MIFKIAYDGVVKVYSRQHASNQDNKVMGEVLRYDSATFIRPRLGKPGKGDLRVFPRADPPRTEEQFNFAVITEFHETDWSGEVSSPNGGFEAAEITKAVSYELRDLKGTRIEPGEQNIEGDLLSIFQKAHARAQDLQVMASLLTVLWIDTSLYVASIGERLTR
jgi:hypothetical protein